MLYEIVVDEDISTRSSHHEEGGLRAAAELKRLNCAFQDGITFQFLIAAKNFETFFSIMQERMMLWQPFAPW